MDERGDTFIAKIGESILIVFLYCGSKHFIFSPYGGEQHRCEKRIHDAESWYPCGRNNIFRLALKMNIRPKEVGIPEPACSGCRKERDGHHNHTFTNE